MLIGLPPRALSILLVCVANFAVAGGIWTAYRLIDVLAAHLAARAAKTETKFDDLMVPLVATSLKIVSTATGLLVCAEAFQLPVTGVLGGLGIGGGCVSICIERHH